MVDPSFNSYKGGPCLDSFQCYVISKGEAYVQQFIKVGP